jgi:hypothetical protein
MSRVSNSRTGEESIAAPAGSGLTRILLVEDRALDIPSLYYRFTRTVLGASASQTAEYCISKVAQISIQSLGLHDPTCLCTYRSCMNAGFQDIEVKSTVVGIAPGGSLLALNIELSQ